MEPPIGRIVVENPLPTYRGIHVTIDGSTAPQTKASEPRPVGDTQDLAPQPTSVDSPRAPGDTQPHESVVEPPTPSTVAAHQPVADAVWRYHLDVLAGEAAGSQVWQATDPVLGRQVGVRLLPSSDERAEDLREAACLAARVSDRRLIHVLDVVDVRFHDEPHIAVVTEWIPGHSLAERLHAPLSSADALRICAEVAECLEASHLEGIAHGRIRPNSVLLTDNGDVRVRGVGVEAVLRGCDPDPDPATSDVNGVGGLLYACVTGRWPYGSLSGVAAAPHMGGSVPLPSRVTPSVPSLVDSLCARSVAGIQAPKDSVRFATMAELSSALRSSVNPARDTPLPALTAARPRRRVGRRLIASVIALLAVAGLALMGWQLVSKGPAPVIARPSAAAPLVSTPSVAPSPVAKVERPLPIVRVNDYDPLGNGQENANQAALAIDSKADTAWTTVVYNDDYLSGKPGVGLLLDLGTARPISAVRLSLLGKGTNVEIRTADKPGDNPDAFRRFGTAASAPGEIVLRSSKPVTARYVLVWLTRVPTTSDGGYQGGISEVAVLG